MKLRRMTLLSVVAGALICGAAFAGRDEAKKLREAGIILPLETILAKAKQTHSGRVAETELERAGDRYIYIIRIVGENGVVRDLKYDARSGEPLREKQREH